MQPLEAEGLPPDLVEALLEKYGRSLTPRAQPGLLKRRQCP